MGENKNDILRDSVYFLFGVTSGCMVGCSFLILIKPLLEEYEKRKLEKELEIQKAVNGFMEALEDAFEKEKNDSVEECISGIRKYFEAKIEKKEDDNKKVCSDSLEECLSNVRKILEDSIEKRKRGIVKDEKLHSDVQECLTDTKKLLE